MNKIYKKKSVNINYLLNFQSYEEHMAYIIEYVFEERFDDYLKII